MVLGATVVALAYLVGRDLLTASSKGDRDIPPQYAEGVGLVAAVTTMVAGQLVLSSVVVMADMAAAFWLALSAWLLVRFNEVARLGVPSDSCSCGRRRRRGHPLGHRARRAGVCCSGRDDACTMQTALAGGPDSPCGGSAGGAATADSQSFWQRRGAGRVLRWLEPRQYLSRTLESEEGLTKHVLPNGIFYLAPWWHPDLMPPTMGLFALPGLIALWGRRRFRTLLFLGIWISVPYLFFIGIPHQNLRYSLTMWVPAVVLVAVGVLDLWHRPSWRLPVVCLLLTSLLGTVLWNGPRWSRTFESHSQVKAMARHLDEMLPADAVVLSFETTLALDHYTDAEVHDSTRWTALICEPSPTAAPRSG